MVYKVLWRNMQPIKPGTPGRTPSLSNKWTGLFYVLTTHTTNGFTSYPKDEAMVKCLAYKDTSVTTGTRTQCGSETPEFESDAVNQLGHNTPNSFFVLQELPEPKVIKLLIRYYFNNFSK